MDEVWTDGNTLRETKPIKRNGTDSPNQARNDQNDDLRALFINSKNPHPLAVIFNKTALVNC